MAEKNDDVERPHEIISTLPTKDELLDRDAETKRRLALIFAASFSFICIVIMLGGLFHRFDASLVEGAAAGMGSCAAAVVAWYFTRGRSGT